MGRKSTVPLHANPIKPAPSYNVVFKASWLPSWRQIILLCGDVSPLFDLINGFLKNQSEQ